MWIMIKETALSAYHPEAIIRLAAGYCRIKVSAWEARI